MELVKSDATRFQQKLERRQRKQATYRVLVVDDEPSIVELLKTALVALDGYEVSIATSAAGAIRAIEATDKPFDCLLLDVQMPGRSGIELLRDLRALPDYENTPVIMLTAMCDRKYVDEAFKEGATDYVTKPFDFLDLRSRMNAAETLMHERAKARKTMESVKELQTELDFVMQFSFDDPLSIDGVDRHLRCVEFDNYIAQLSRGRLFNSQVVAVKLLEASFHYDTSTSGDFRQVIADLAWAISRSTQGKDCMFSYRGSGTFLVVEHGKRPVSEFLAEADLNKTLYSILGQRRAADPQRSLGERRPAGPQRALVGEPVSVRSLSRSRAFSALTTAVANADSRERAVLSASGEEKPDGTPVAPEQRERSRRRIYERVLVELFREETYLHAK